MSFGAQLNLYTLYSKLFRGTLTSVLPMTELIWQGICNSKVVLTLLLEAMPIMKFATRSCITVKRTSNHAIKIWALMLQETIYLRMGRLTSEFHQQYLNKKLIYNITNFQCYFLNCCKHGAL